MSNITASVTASVNRILPILRGLNQEDMLTIYQAFPIYNKILEAAVSGSRSRIRDTLSWATLESLRSNLPPIRDIVDPLYIQILRDVDNLFDQ